MQENLHIKHTKAEVEEQKKRCLFVLFGFFEQNESCFEELCGTAVALELQG